MNQAPPLIAPQPKRTGWIVYSVIVTFLLFLAVLAGFVLFALVFGGGDRTAGLEARRVKYEERYLQGDAGARNKIAVVYLTGVISEADGMTSDQGIVGDIKDQIDQALEDKRVKAIILRINSPGGEVVASDEIYRAVAAAREKKPVVASMETVGASGAYYAAMGASYVMATDLTITGSIGVILQSFTFSGLMDKVGVKSYTFKSGEYKDILNPTREPTPAESNLVQNLIMEVYDKFIGIVAKERKMDVEELRSGLADGRILSGKQAKEAGFVDGLGYFDDAVEKAKELANIREARVIRYMAPFSLRNLLRFLGSNDRTKIELQLSPTTFKLESGKLYFLPAYMFQ
ncbi:MAG: signal peptide peptidase SppA [Verrucomicrobiia bacterium]